MMNISRSFGALLTAASLLVVGVVGVQAQPPEAPPDNGERSDNAERRGRWGDPAEMFKMMDQNGDGVLEASEFRGPEEFFKRMDEDGDGKIPEAEFNQIRERFQQSRGERGRDWSERRSERPEDRGPNLDRIKEELGVTDEEWTVLKPRIEKVVSLERKRDFPEAQALQDIVKKQDAAAEEIRAKMKELRAARSKAKEELKTSREELKELLTVKQEAVLMIHNVIE